MFLVSSVIKHVVVKTPLHPQHLLPTPPTHTHISGWWFVSNGQEEGWAPCSYLESMKGDKEDDDAISSLGECVSV